MASTPVLKFDRFRRRLDAPDGVRGNRRCSGIDSSCVHRQPRPVARRFPIELSDARTRSILLAGFIAALVVAPAGAGAAPKAPARLSAEPPPPLAESDHGSGNFGRWGLDEFGLPQFRYDLDQIADSRGAVPEANGDRRSQHQLGNDHVNAFAWNDGTTSLWSQARLSQWANKWDANAGKWSGGYGYLHVDGKVASTLWLDRPADSGYERRFGTGYFRKTLRAEGIDVREEVYAPFGDDPLLLHDVTLTNPSDRARTATWFEYWDVNPVDATRRSTRGVRSPTWDAERRTLIVDQLPGDLDLEPHSIFAAALEGPVAGFDTSHGAFFGTPASRQAPAAVQADRSSNSIAPPAPVGPPSQTVLTFRSPVELAPGQSVTLRYAYGMASRASVAGLVERYRTRSEPFARSQREWADWLPQADFGAANRAVARELKWGAYLLRTATVYEEECGAHTITQGGYYQYAAGLNLGYRSWLHYLLPMAWTEPELAREILRYSIKLQPEDGFVPYGSGPLCTRFDLGTSNDLDFWLLLAAGEYGLAMRDPEFFDEPLPFHDSGRRVSAWEHVKLSFRHQESMRGPNGGYIMGTTGDWSDFATPLGPMTESMLVAAQLAYAYPKLADLAELRGDHAFAGQLRRRGEELRRTTAENWTGRGWFARGYFGNRQIGKGLPYGEPQPWALLAGAATPDRARTLVANVRRFLTGHGAPGGPSVIGSAMAPAREDPDITEHGPALDPTEGQIPDVLGMALEQIPGAPLAGAAAFPGGAWFDVNGHLTWALGEQDGIVPGARELAWDEYTRNTLAAHATAYPDHWNGTINVDDVCNAWYSSDPTRCGIGVFFSFIGSITEQPTWMTMNAIRLAGVTATGDGYHIDPHLPMRRFTVRTQRVGVAAKPRMLRGYVRPERGGAVEMEVVLPATRLTRRAVVYVNRRRVRHRVVGHVIHFRAPTRAGRATDWAVVARR